MATSTIPSINAEMRDRTGSRDTQRLREKGRLPAVIYGHKKEPAHVHVDQSELIGLLREHAHVIEVSFNGTTEACLVKDLQWDYLGDSVIHVDLARVDMTESVNVEVEIAIKGEAIGLKEAGTYFDHPMPALEVACLANQIPESIEVDVSEIEAGKALTASEVPLPGGVTLVTPGDAIVASVQLKGPGEEEEEEVGEGVEGPAEPEVIGKAEEGAGSES